MINVRIFSLLSFESNEFQMTIIVENLYMGLALVHIYMALDIVSPSLPPPISVFLCVCACVWVAQGSSDLHA